MLEWLQSNGDGFFLNTLYDIFKFIIGYLVAQWLYEGVYKKRKYGGWHLELLETEEGGEILATRKITPIWAEKIFKDDYDFSVYVKGFISPFFFLNIDVSSEEAQRIGLIKIDNDTQKIIITQSKNPSKV